MSATTVSNLINSLPYILIDVGGLIYAIVRWRKHPRLSGLLTAAIVLSLGRTLYIDFIINSIEGLHRKPGWMLIDSAMTVASVLGYLLLMVAAFYGFHEAAVARKA